MRSKLSDSRFSRQPLSCPALLVCAAGLAAGAAAYGQPEFRTLAVSGQPVPGMPPGVVFEFFSSPRVNDAGTIAFWARSAGPTPADPTPGSIWTISPDGTLTRIVGAGDVAPFDPAFRFTATFDPSLDELGGVTFTGSFSDAPSPGQSTPAPAGLFAASGGVIRDLGARDDAPSGLPPTQDTFTGVMTAATASSGFSIFSANGGRGVWAASARGTELLAGRDQQAPGLPSGVQFLHLDPPAQGAPSSLLFRSTLRLMAGDTHGPASLWSDRGGMLAPLAIAGDPAPGGPEGATFADFGTRPVMNVQRHAVFAATLEGGATTPESDTGLWTDRSGSLAPLAREGDPAPGVPGAVYASISPRPAVSPRSDVAFVAQLAGEGLTPSNNSGLFRSRADGMDELIAREGDQVPGMAPGVRFAIFHEPAINFRGQVAFMARLRGDEGAGVGPTNNVALFYTDPCQGVVPVVRTGDVFTVTPPGGSPEQRTVAEIVFDSEPAAAGRGQFNRRGTLVFTLRFADGSSGLFSAHTFLSADANRDGEINSADVSWFLMRWLASVTDGTLEADFDHSGAVNSADITAFIAAWTANTTGGC